MLRVLGPTSVLIALWFASPVFAQAEADSRLEQYLEAEISQFQPYEPNYAIWQFTEEDNDALEAHYSFKYLFTRNDCSDDSLRPLETKRSCIDRYRNRWEVFLKFTGEFDFYFGSRESGPVINRTSNPGLHYRKYTNSLSISDSAKLVYWDLGIQHFSNGQVVDAELRRDGQFRSQFFYDIDPFSPYFDTISRGVDFLSIESRFRLGPGAGDSDPITSRCSGGSGCFDFWVRLLPYYINDDNPVTWGPDAGLRREVADFERFRFVLSRYRTYRSKNAGGFGIRASELSITWHIGDDGLDTDSFDVGLFLPIQIGRRFEIPLFFEYHSGPLNNLSNYSTNQDSFGIGLRFY